MLGLELRPNVEITLFILQVFPFCFPPFLCSAKHVRVCILKLTKLAEEVFSALGLELFSNTISLINYV